MNNSIDPFTLKVWRLHPHSAPITPADMTLDGQAPQMALRYCGPYLHANGAGFYIHSPVDLDVSYHPDQEQPWQVTFYQDYEDEEVQVFFDMLRRSDFEKIQESVPHVPRKKFRFQSPDKRHHPAPVTPNQFMIWLGCSFETPPNWGLWIRGPVNRNYDVPYRVDEAVLETDWLPQDIWINLRFIRPGEVARIRRDGEPIAHLVPVSRAAYENWQLEDHVMNEDTPEARQMFNRWIDYNHQKYHGPDSTGQRTYRLERKQQTQSIEDEESD